MIRHVVMWKFKEGAESEAKRFKEELEALVGQIPEILHLEVGETIGVEGNVDMVLISDFASLEAMEIYQKHPLHVAVGAICKPICVQRTAVDYEIGEK